MATVKVTVTLPKEQLSAVRDVVARGGSPNVSAFVQHSVSLALDDIAGWQELLTEAMEQTGGQLSKDERSWADQVLLT